MRNLDIRDHLTTFSNEAEQYADAAFSDGDDVTASTFYQLAELATNLFDALAVTDEAVERLVDTVRVVHVPAVVRRVAITEGPRPRSVMQEQYEAAWRVKESLR